MSPLMLQFFLANKQNDYFDKSHNKALFLLCKWFHPGYWNSNVDMIRFDTHNFKWLFVLMHYISKVSLSVLSLLQ